MIAHGISRNGGLQTAELIRRLRRRRSLMVWTRHSPLSLALIFLLACASSLNAQTVVIGSKKFTESYVLGEIAKRAFIDAAIPADHRQGMGGTIILWEALRDAQIGVYPEYTGTITQEILKTDHRLSIQEIRDALQKSGVGMTEPIGFNNTYALVMRRDKAEQFGVRSITDLRNHSELRFGLTHEFLDRQDGWRPLANEYQLSPRSIIGIDHALGYAALKSGEIDVKDAYSTDAKIADFNLVTLEDDRNFSRDTRRCFCTGFLFQDRPSPHCEQSRVESTSKK